MSNLTDHAPCDSPAPQMGSNMCQCGVPLRYHAPRCDAPRCQETASWTITAIYPADATHMNRAAVHPLWASYPMPMYRVCGEHLAVMCAFDSSRGGATGAWLIRPAKVAQP